MSDPNYPVTVTLFDQERYDGVWMPENLGDAIAWLQAMLDQVPIEHRGTAQIEIDSRSGYEDSHYATIRISYERPPTAEERAQRIADAQTRLDAARNQEIALLRSLQAKYGRADT